MTATPKKGRVGLLGLLPVVLVPVAFLAVLPWLKTVGGQMVSLVGAAAAIFVVSYANYLTFRVRRGLDEVEKASLGFASQWGVAAGQAAFVLLIALPPFLDFATVLVRDLARDPGASEKVVILAMTLGFCAIVLLQGIGSLVVRAIWWRTKR